MVRGLEEARAAADDLRRRSSRWQQVLTAGVTDLVADIDFDLRDRSRVVVREAEAAIDAQDPGPMWPELSAWLDRRLAAAGRASCAPGQKGRRGPAHRGPPRL